MEKNHDKLIQIVLLGETNVGKTTIFNRFCDNVLDRSCISTIGVEFKVKQYKYKNNNYSLQIFDTAGQERFRSVTQAYYKMGDGFIIVFDLTNQDSLNAVDEWINNVKDTIENPKYIIIGNKDDIKEQIPEENIKKVINKYNNITYIKTSAVKNTNINKTFETMIDIINIEKKNINNATEEIKIEKPNKKGKKDNKSRCC